MTRSCPHLPTPARTRLNLRSPGVCRPHGAFTETNRASSALRQTDRNLEAGMRQTYPSLEAERDHSAPEIHAKEKNCHRGNGFHDIELIPSNHRQEDLTEACQQEQGRRVRPASLNLEPSLWLGVGRVYRGNNVRFGSKADMCNAPTHVRFTPKRPRKRTSVHPILCAAVIISL
jgi:hypothetical protein